jgi:hypothetical protein
MEMRSHRLLAVLAGVLLTTACGQSEQTPADRPLAGSPASSAADPSYAPQEKMVTGALQRVDMDTKTFVLTAEGQDYVFAFSDLTQVTGAAGTQGLSGREGAVITVHYRDEGGAFIAERIELEE